MRALVLAAAVALASPAMAQDHSAHGAPPPAEQDEHAGHRQDEPSQPRRVITLDAASLREAQMQAEAAAVPASSTPPPRAFEGPAHAAAAIWGEEAMARVRADNHLVHGAQSFATLMAERFEARIGEGHEGYLWDLQGWYGTTTDRAVFKSEGEGEFGGNVEEAELQLLWGHAIGPWFDLQAGLRLDVEPQTTAHLALGVQGLAPYMIHLDAAAFLSDAGDLTARIEAEHDMRLTQRLILQPRVEAELSAQDIPERGVGAGLPHLSTGLRLRYEFVPEFAPYIGVEYETATGRTADFLRAAGEDPDGVSVLLGLRFWF